MPVAMTDANEREQDHLEGGNSERTAQLGDLWWEEQMRAYPQGVMGSNIKKGLNLNLLTDLNLQILKSNFLNIFIGDGGGHHGGR